MPFAYTAEVNSFDPAYMDLLKLAQSEPNAALEQLESIDMSDFSANQKAQHFYFKSIFFSYLDYPNKGIKAAENGLNFVTKQEQPWLYHHLMLEKIHAMTNNGKGLNGFSDAEKALEWATANDDLQLKLNSLYVLSNLYIQIEDYYKALDLVQEGYELAPEEGIEFVKADFSSQLSGIYIYRNEFSIALPYLEEVYEHEKSQGNLLGMTVGLYELGRAYMVLENHELGIKYLQESLKISEQIQDLQGIAYANNELATHYIEKKEYSEAEALLLKSAEIFSQSGNVYLLFDTYYQLTNVYTESGDIESAEKYIALAKPLIANEGHQYGAIAIKRLEANLLAAKNHHDQAFIILKETIKQQNELDAKQSAEKLHAIRAHYELESKNKENELLTNKNVLQEQELDRKTQQNIWLVTLLVSLLVITALFIYFTIKLRTQTKKLHYLANYDELTGLRNRNNTITVIRKQVDNLSEQENLFLVMVDLDHFKNINDQFGHVLGDKVLSYFGELCMQLFSENTIVGRVGGEEFMICIRGKSKQEVNELVELLRVKTEKMSEHMSAPGLTVSISAGICQADEVRNSFRTLHKCADEAMYQAKNTGRNRIVSN
ncbi:MAG: diguanylate cyclase [Marinicella sp.]